MDSSQRVDIAHHIGMLMIQANNAGALQWGSSIYLKVIKQSSEVLPYEERHLDDGVGLGFNEPMG